MCVWGVLVVLVGMDVTVVQVVIVVKVVRLYCTCRVGV